MNNFLSQLTVLRAVGNDKTIHAFAEAAVNGEARGNFLYELYQSGAENNFYGYVFDRVLTDENAFSLACAEGKAPSRFLKSAYAADLKIIAETLYGYQDGGRFCKGKAEAPFEKISDGAKPDFEELAKSLQTFYRKNGYGIFIRNSSFTLEEGKLCPIVRTSPIELSDLKHYEYEKKVIGDNIESFLSGLPYSNMLLYGDRGTGKSSTIHAMLNKYFANGLRIIELDKNNLESIPEIRRILPQNSLKFIIFIDDLSLQDGDGQISTLKSNLEGSLNVGNENVMIVVTSNRRHIVKESFTDRDNSVHAGDSIAEQLSLSDRFGLTVLFSTTDKQGYLAIVNALADDRRLNTDRALLENLAERWAIAKGGRSPRRAKQFVDLAYSCEQRGRNIGQLV